MLTKCIWLFTIILTQFFGPVINGQDNSDKTDWWMTPHRMVQTNLREIDATMDVDQYVREVKEFGANVVLFNVGGIVANYPTELQYHWQNTHMEGDLVGTVLPKLHAEGIKMVGRFDFSKINEKYAAENPDWLYVSEKGEKVNYNGQVHTCLMGGYQQDYMFKILKEATTRYPLDAVFFNMIGFPQTDYSRVFHGICQCENCKKSFKEYSGLDLPKHDGDPEILEKHKQWQQNQIDKQFKNVRDLIKSVRTDIAICTYTREYIDVIRSESSAPTVEEPWHDLVKSQSLLLNYPGRQLANASVHFPRMIFRHSGVAPYLHSQRLWQLLTNGAWLDFYCIGPLQRLEDRAGLGPASDVYRFHAANEKWLLHTESAAELGVLHHPGDDFWGWVQLLSEHHIPFDLVSMQFSDLSKYKALVVPSSDRVGSDDAKVLDAWVKEGGKLLLSGKMPGGLSCLGQPVLVKTWPERHSMYVRIRPEDKDHLAMEGLKDYDLSHLRGEFYEYETVPGSQSFLKLIHDVTYGPPEKCYIHSVSDIPGMWARNYGSGTAAIIPFAVGDMYHEWANQSHTLLAVGSLDNILNTERRLHVETSPLVEISHRRDVEGKFEWIGFQNHTGHLVTSIHEPLPIYHVKAQLKTEGKIKRVSTLSNNATLTPRQIEPGLVEIILPQLNVFDMVLVEYE